MFGYIKPVRNQITDAEYRVYCAFFCGLCKATKKQFGLRARLTTNYDITFLALILHDYTRQLIDVTTERCLLHMQKQSIISINNLIKKLTAFNLLLAYYKLLDDYLDNESLKTKLKIKIFKASYIKAKNKLPNVDNIIYSNYSKLHKMEKDKKLFSVEVIADIFANMMIQCIKNIINVDLCINMANLCYNIGKYIYLIDALDDIDDDVANNNFNAFVKVYNIKSKIELIKKYNEEINFIFYSTINKAIECYDSLSFVQSYNLTKNIVHNGLINNYLNIYNK